MYLVLVILAAVGVVMAASAAITALAQSLAKRRAGGLHESAGLPIQR